VLNAPVFTVIGLSPLAVRRLVYTALFTPPCFTPTSLVGWQGRKRLVRGIQHAAGQ